MVCSISTYFRHKLELDKADESYRAKKTARSGTETRKLSIPLSQPQAYSACNAQILRTSSRRTANSYYQVRRKFAAQSLLHHSGPWTALKKEAYTLPF